MLAWMGFAFAELSTTTTLVIGDEVSSSMSLTTSISSPLDDGTRRMYQIDNSVINVTITTAPIEMPTIAPMDKEADADAELLVVGAVFSTAATHIVFCERI